jgi:hypothetical protein
VLAVGQHELLARAKGYGELKRAVVVQGREDESLTIDLEPFVSPVTQAPTVTATPSNPHQQISLAPHSDLPHAPNRAAAVTVFAVGAAGVIAGGIFAGLALGDKSQLDASKCPNQACPPPYHSKNDEMQAFANFATAGVAIGVVGATVGSYLWITGSKAPSDLRHSARVTPFIGFESVGLKGQF